MQIWKHLIIETEYDSKEACIHGINNSTSNRSKSNFWRKGVVGDLSSDGKFKLTLNRGIHSYRNYIGEIQMREDKAVLIGIVKPKIFTEVFIIFAAISNIFSMIINILRSFFDQSYKLNLSQIIGFMMFFIFFYGIERIGEEITTLKIRKRLTT